MQLDINPPVEIKPVLQLIGDKDGKGHDLPRGHKEHVEDPVVRV